MQTRTLIYMSPQVLLFCKHCMQRSMLQADKDSLADSCILTDLFGAKHPLCYICLT